MELPHESLSPVAPTGLDAHVERWSAIALERDWVSSWVEGAIFPRELVVFLALCDHLGVRTVVESGRQDGYSTALLGEWSEAGGGRVVSIDLELDQDRAVACRERLARFPRVDIRRGDSFELVGRALQEAAGPVALLMDGPKGYPALSLSLASASIPSVALVGQHNLNPGEPETALIRGRSGRAVHYEELVGTGGEAFEALGEREVAFCRESGAARSLEHSTLGLVVIGPVRRRLWSTVHPRLVLLQPPLVAALWRLRRHGLLRRLARASFALYRRLPPSR